MASPFEAKFRPQAARNTFSFRVQTTMQHFAESHPKTTFTAGVLAIFTATQLGGKAMDHYRDGEAQGWLAKWQQQAGQKLHRAMPLSPEETRYAEVNVGARVAVLNFAGIDYGNGRASAIVGYLQPGQTLENPIETTGQNPTIPSRPGRWIVFHGQSIQEGLYDKNGNPISVDADAVLAFYKEYAKPTFTRLADGAMDFGNGVIGPSTADIAAASTTR